MGEHKLKLREIADILKILEGNVFKILHGSLGMRKWFSKWVPHLLTPDQKQKHGEDSERCLETTRSSAKWTAAGESRPKRPKTHLSTILKKVISTATVTWHYWID